MNASLMESHNASTHADVDCAPLRFERRCGDRWGVHGVATAFRLSGEGFGRFHELELCDMSNDGLGAISQSAIEPGSIVSIGFQNPSHLARRGTVVRCTPCGHGYHVAIRFELRLAA